MKNQMKSGVILIIFGILVILCAFKVPSPIVFFRGILWQWSLFLLGGIFVLIGIVNLFTKDK